MKRKYSDPLDPPEDPILCDIDECLEKATPLYPPDFMMKVKVSYGRACLILGVAYETHTEFQQKQAEHTLDLCVELIHGLVDGL